MATINDKITFLNKVFGTCVIGSDGLNAAVCCPNPKCGSYGSPTKKKLVIKIDSDQFHCWVCDLRGRTLHAILRRYSPSYLHEYERKFAGKKKLLIIDAPEEELVICPPGFKLLATSTSIKDPDVQDTIRYARSRNLTNRDFWYFKLGTCTSGKFRRRLIMPSFDDNGDLNYYVARAIDDAKSYMKYLNAKVSKKNVIFNEINIDWSKELTLVEGPMDLTKCDSNATCLLGSHFSEDYATFRAIIKNRTPVLLALDSDMSDKVQKYCKLLSSYGIDVRVLKLGPFSDVGEMNKVDFLHAKRAAMPWSTSDRLYHLIGSIRSGSLI
jgi:hypothetical protein